MDIKDIWRRFNIYIIGAVVVLAVVVFAVILFPRESRVEVMQEITADPVEIETEQHEEPPAAEAGYIFVEVKGAVEYPGVFEVPKDARVKNVLEMAQLKPDADLVTVNQSKKLADEMVIYVPKAGEIEAFDPVAESAGGAENESETVNINTAGTQELTTLNGIGEKKAQVIVDYREENGLFIKPEDLMNIPGIGEKTFESLKPYITID